MSKNDDVILVAKTTGSMRVGKEEFFFTRGVTRIRASHPLAKAAPDFFEEIDVHYDVEQTTAAPGEKR